MSLSNTNLLLQIGQLPATFRGSPNEFLAELVRRAKIVSPSGTNFIFVGDVEPTSNVGPWLNNDRWLVWNDELKRYAPLDITDSLQSAPEQALWFQVGATTPAAVIPPVWLKTTTGTTTVGASQGTPVGWYLYNGSAWQPVVLVLDQSITLAKVASGVPGSLITFQADGRPILLPIGNNTDVLTSDGVNPSWVPAPDWTPVSSSTPGPNLTTLHRDNILGAQPTLIGTVNLTLPTTTARWKWVRLVFTFDATHTGGPDPFIGFDYIQIRIGSDPGPVAWLQNIHTNPFTAGPPQPGSLFSLVAEGVPTGHTGDETLVLNIWAKAIDAGSDDPLARVLYAVATAQ